MPADSFTVVNHLYNYISLGKNTLEGTVYHKQIHMNVFEVRGKCEEPLPPCI